MNQMKLTVDVQRESSSKIEAPFIDNLFHVAQSLFIHKTFEEYQFHLTH